VEEVVEESCYGGGKKRKKKKIDFVIFCVFVEIINVYES
jgi:hypothetical protein